ncbi:MAG: hypothetical protein AAF889_04130 [Cyanobacteria bacterium P01_D01_bin.73]
MVNNADRSDLGLRERRQTRVIPLVGNWKLGPVLKSVWAIAPIALRRMMGTPVAAENCPEIFPTPI